MCVAKGRNLYEVPNKSSFKIPSRTLNNDVHRTAVSWAMGHGYGVWLWGMIIGIP